MSCQTTLGVEMQAVEVDAPRRQHTRASVNENMEHHLQLGADNESVDDGYGELGRRRAVDSSRGTSVRQVIDTGLHLYKRPQYYYYTAPLNDLCSRTTRASRYQKSKTALDLNEARDNGVLGWQLHHTTQ